MGLPGARHYALAGTVIGRSDHIGARLVGDPLVTGYSAEGRSLSAWKSALGSELETKHLPRIGHLALAHHEDVYAQILTWWDGL